MNTPRLERAFFEKGRRLGVIYNPRAGSAGSGQVLAGVLDTLARSGAQVQHWAARNASQVCELTERCLSQAVDVVVGIGGDGTLNAIGSRLVGTGVPFAALPGGTFNYFVRNLGLPDDAVAAAHALLDGDMREIGVGTVNGTVFLNNASFGLYRHVIEERERHKSRFGRNRVVALLSGLVTALRPHAVYEVELNAASAGTYRLRSPMVFFGCNRLQMAALSPRLAGCVEHDELAVLALMPMTRLDTIRVGVRALNGTLDASDRVRILCTHDSVVHRAGHTVRCAIDGEVRKFLLPLHVALRPRALRVLVPRAPGMPGMKDAVMHPRTRSA
jgi:diacylglycerol kinase family enzyme